MLRCLPGVCTIIHSQPWGEWRCRAVVRRGADNGCVTSLDRIACRPLAIVDMLLCLAEEDTLIRDRLLRSSVGAAGQTGWLDMNYAQKELRNWSGREILDDANVIYTSHKV